MTERADHQAVGRLQPVLPRLVWPHEALDFTPWLLRNVDVLSELLGMDLVLEVAEHPVGGFSLDLLGRDANTGEAVIVEISLSSPTTLTWGRSSPTPPARIRPPSCGSQHRSVKSIGRRSIG